jgi:hypothetical protein
MLADMYLEPTVSGRAEALLGSTTDADNGVKEESIARYMCDGVLSFAEYGHQVLLQLSVVKGSTASSILTLPEKKLWGV